MAKGAGEDEGVSKEIKGTKETKENKDHKDPLGLLILISLFPFSYRSCCHDSWKNSRNGCQHLQDFEGQGEDQALEEEIP